MQTSSCFLLAGRFVLRETTSNAWRGRTETQVRAPLPFQQHLSNVSVRASRDLPKYNKHVAKPKLDVHSRAHQSLGGVPQLSPASLLDGVWGLGWTNYPLQRQAGSLLDTTSLNVLPIWHEQGPAVVQHIDTQLGRLSHAVYWPIAAKHGQWMLEAALHFPQGSHNLSFTFAWSQIAFACAPLPAGQEKYSFHQPRIWHRTCRHSPSYHVHHVYVDRHIRVAQMEGYWFVWRRLQA